MTDWHSRIAAAFAAPFPTDVLCPAAIPHAKIAGVLVPLFVRPGAGATPEEDVRVLLTVRSSRLASHPGEVAFPGGKWDRTDATLIDTALREASEEIGLPPDLATVVGTVPARLARNSIAVFPVVAVLSAAFCPSLSPVEVVQVFDVPLVTFLRSEHHIHTDINYFGTPSFRVHSFDVTTNILLSSPVAPDAPLPVVEALQTGSFREDAQTPASRRPALEHAPMLAGSTRLNDSTGSIGRQVVFGLTSAVLIEVASVVFGQSPQFALHGDGGLYKAEPAYIAAARSAKL